MVNPCWKSVSKNDVVHSGDGKVDPLCFFILISPRRHQKSCSQSCDYTQELPQELIHKQKMYFSRLALSMFPSLLMFVCLLLCLGLSLFYTTLSLFCPFTMTLEVFVMSTCVCLLCLLAVIYHVVFDYDHCAFLRG